jgi:hypothetical protein
MGARAAVCETRGDKLGRSSRRDGLRFPFSIPGTSYRATFVMSLRDTDRSPTSHYESNFRLDMSCARLNPAFLLYSSRFVCFLIPMLQVGL